MRQFTVRRLVMEACRVVVVLGCLAAATAPTNSVMAEPFAPYRARVVAPSAEVRSGPSEGFYPTEVLAEGDAVDVYRQDANGWCAIRPPEGSFSWVFGRHLRLLNGPDRDGPNRNDQETPRMLGEIDKPDVASRIGSRLSNQRNAVQIRLKQGEVVQVIGEESSDGETWYKVSPPAGEFRWIHAGSIRRSGPIPRHETEPPLDPIRDTVQAASSEAATPEPAAEADAVTVVAATTPSEEPTAETAAGDDWRAASDSNRFAATHSAGEAERAGEMAAAPGESEPQQPPESPPIAGSQPIANVPSDLSRSLTELELRLSRMVVEPPVAWNIASLDAQGETLLARAQTVAERNAVQATLSRIDRFAAIERRYRTAPGATSRGWSGSGTGLAPVGQPAGGAAGSQSQIANQPAAGNLPYDAVGVLRPVVSQRPGAPPFALVDQRGAVVSFVTPTPGVNLQPYLGQWIGVAGNRGFIPELQQAHVAAGRVAPLDARFIR